MLFRSLQPWFMSGRQSNGNGLTQKQRSAVANAPPRQRARLTQVFRSQPRRGQVPIRNIGRRPAMAVPRMLPQTAPRSRQPRPASARANGSGLSLKAALSIWDPLNPTPIPTAVSDGHAHANTGMDRKSFTLLQSERAMLLISNTGTSGMVGALVQWTPNSTTLTWSNLVLPTLASNGHAGEIGRASCRERV